MSHLSNDSFRVTIYFNLHLYFSLRTLTFHVCMYKYNVYSYFTYLFIPPIVMKSLTFILPAYISIM